MDLSELRIQIDALDRQLAELLERRMDVAAEIAAYKQAHGLPVLDASREAEKLASIRTMCRPETAELVSGVFETVMAASRAWQETLMEGRHGG